MTPQEQAALVALRALHGALEVARERYIDGEPEDGMARWAPTSLRAGARGVRAGLRLRAAARLTNTGPRAILLFLLFFR
jgi:hypothetical protein